MNRSASVGKRKYGRARNNVGFLTLSEIKEPFEIKCGMKMTRAPDNHTATIKIRANFLALFFFRHKIGFGFRMAIEKINFFLHGREMRATPGANEISRSCPTALDILTRDQIFDMAEGFCGIIQKGLGFLCRQRFGDIAFADIHTPRHHAAISR